MIFRHQTISHRLTWAGLSLFLPAGMFWLFANGLTASVIQPFMPKDLTIEYFKPEQTKKPPPPEPKTVERLKIPTVEMPSFDIARGATGNSITTIAPQAGNDPPPVLVPDRAPAIIAATRTTPPYPVIARRVGWEGSVMLRLTVSPQGRVARADVVTSSGHSELDRTAQDWVMAHWRYRPAIKDGAAIEAQVLTKILFSLDASR
jgi:protein TonB